MMMRFNAQVSIVLMLSVASLGAAKNLSFIANDADKFAMQIRASLHQTQPGFLSKRSISASATTPSHISQIASELTSNGVTQAKLGLAAYNGLATLADLLDSGASTLALVEHSIISLGTIVGGAVGAVFPIAGLVATVFSSVVGGLLGSFGGSGSPTQALYELIIEQVGLMIARNNLVNRLTTVQNTLAAVVEEVSWVPDILEEWSDDVQTSWLLQIQHTLELAWRDVFGDCVLHPTSTACRDWQEAGTIEVALRFSALHISIVTSLATVNASTGTTVGLIRERTNYIANRYAPLLWDSLNTFKSYRLGGIGVTNRERGEISKCGREQHRVYFEIECVDSRVEESSAFPTRVAYRDGCTYKGQRTWYNTQLAAVELACARRAAHARSLLNDLEYQIQALMRPVSNATATCPVKELDHGVCKESVAACKHGKESAAQNGCEAFALGWEQTRDWTDTMCYAANNQSIDARCTQAPYPQYGDRFIQIGDWRIGDVNGRHASISHKHGKTAQIFRSDGKLHPGPRSDYSTWSRPVGAPSGIHFGDRFVQIGEWRIGDVNGAHASISHKDGKTAQIFRSDGTLHPGPRSDWSTWSRSLGSVSSGISVGSNFIEIGKWRLGDVGLNEFQQSHVSMAHQDGKTAQIYRSTGTLHKGPRTDWSSWSRPVAKVFTETVPQELTGDARVWYSLADNWVENTCDDSTCQLRCTKDGRVINSDYGPEYGAGQMQTCLTKPATAPAAPTCQGCMPASRSFSCCDSSECNSFCDDIYREDAPQALVCKRGCAEMAATTSCCGLSV